MVRHIIMKNLTHNVNVNLFGAISYITFCQNCIVSHLNEFESFHHWPTLKRCR